MMRWLFDGLAGSGPGARLTVLMFHRVNPLPDELFPSEVHRQSFDTICGWVRAWFQVLPLSEAVMRLQNQSLPSRAMAITFDDGYADNHDVALPVLQRHGLNATFFVSTGFLDGGRMWNDTVIEAVRHAQVQHIDLRADALPALRAVFDLGTVTARRAAVQRLIAAVKYEEPQARLAHVQRIAHAARAHLPDGLMMTSQQVQALHRAGMQLGAHTHNHPILSNLDDAAAMEEIGRSRRVLEGLLDASVEHFAYPNGKPGVDYTERDAALVRRLGFRTAFSTAPGVATVHSDPFQLPRYTPWRRHRLGFAGQLAANLRRKT